MFQRLNITKKKLPLSYYQKPFWLQWKLNPNSSRYNTPLVYRIEGPLNKEALQSALSEYINDYHQGGKHYFYELQNGEVEQRVLEKIEVILEEEEIATGIEAFIQRFCYYYFDLSKPPLFKFGILKVNENDHVLVLSFHHIITDAFTARFLVKNVSELYNHYVAGTHKPMIPKQNLETVLSTEDQWYPLEKRAIDLEYWKQKLFGKDLKVDFEFDKKQSINQKKVSSSYFSVNRETTQSLRQLAKVLGTTPFVVLSTVYAILLYRYTSQAQFCLSYFVNIRQMGFRCVPGCLINTVPLLITLDRQETFQNLIKRATRERKEARLHQNCSLLDIIESIKNENSTDLMDHFNLAFAEGNLNLEPLSLFGARVSNIHFKKEESFSHLLLLYEINEKVECRLDYRESIFELEFIQRFIDHFQRLLEYCLSNMDTQLINFPSLLSNEEQLILKGWNKNGQTFPENKTLHQLFEEQVLQTPQRIALIDKKQSMTYEVLNKKVNQLARGLQETLMEVPKLKNSNKTEIKIAISMDRQTELVIGILAILKIGACYIPLDPEDAPNRLQTVLDNVQPDIVLTLKQFVAKMPLLKSCKKVICVDAEWKLFEHFPENNLAIQGISSDLAYIVHTSGSTGVPKGVMIEHKSIVNVIFDLKNRLNITENDRILNLSSMAYDGYGLELYLALFSGACHILCSSSEMRDPKKLELIIRKQNPSIVHASPTLLSILLQTTEEKLWPFTILSVAEALPVDLAKKLKERSKAVWNLYGPTETTIISTVEKIEEGYASCIGRGIANTELMVLDDDLKLLPIGMVGELYISGVGLARGYLNAPELTHQKFIQNKVSSDQILKMYKTGDRVRWLPNGKLQFCGRRDHQIKIRGFRVELKEIENVLLSHSQILQCVVDAVSHHDQLYLIAYYVPKRSKILGQLFPNLFQVDINLIKRFLKDRLPSFMQPSFFVKLDKLPVSMSGKIDRSKLPKPDDLDFIQVGKSVRPYDLVEFRLKEIWKSLLKHDFFGIYDEFTSIGGDSIAAVHLVSELKKQFNVQYPVAWVLTHNTIRLQANQIRLSGNNPSFYNPIISFNKVENKPSLFLVNPALAGAEVYEDFSKVFSKEFSFYAFDSYNLNSGKPYSPTVEALAEKYIEYLQMVQPEGPYFLGGWSFGGIIAYEMAQQLQRKGEIISKVYLMDAYIVKPAFVEDVLTILNEDELIEAVPEAWQEYLTSLPQSYLARVFQCFHHDIQMRNQYALKPYSGPVMLLKTTRFVQGNKFFQNYIYSGWKPFIRDLEVKFMNADHFTLMEGEAVKEVAEIIEKDINLVSQTISVPA